MSDHLPECGVRKPCGVCGNITYGVCICDRLRACEQRSYSLGIEVGKHDGWLAGYAAALDAAREAVAELWKDGDVASDDAVWIVHDDALAAIDGLRSNAAVTKSLEQAAAIDALREVDTPQQQRTEHINLEQ